MESLHYLLMKTNAMFNRRILVQAGQLGLTAGQPKVLECLSRCGEADQRTIASYCEIEPATVGSILLRMEQEGLVLRRQRDEDRRARFVSLTERGSQAAKEMAEGFRRVDEGAERALTPQELEQLKALLQKLWETM